MYLDNIIESINFQASNISSGNDTPTAEFYDHFSNELVPALINLIDED